MPILVHHDDQTLEPVPLSHRANVCQSTGKPMFASGEMSLDPSGAIDSTLNFCICVRNVRGQFDPPTWDRSMKANVAA